MLWLCGLDLTTLPGPQNYGSESCARLRYVVSVILLFCRLGIVLSGTKRLRIY